MACDSISPRNYLGGLMSKVCEICNKGPLFGHNVSHSNKKSNRRWDPNLKKVKALVGDQVKYIKVCTKCLKAGKVKIAV